MTVELSKYFNMNQGMAKTNTTELDVCTGFIRVRIIACTFPKEHLKEIKEITLKNRLKYILSEFTIF